MNKALLIGNLTRDPETRTTQSGTACATFTIAINRPPKPDGTREADYPAIVAWGKTGELCGKFLHKGSKCAVEGHIQTRTYDAQDGSKRHVTEIVADRVEFLTPKGQQEQTQGQPKSDENGFTEVDDELPF